MPVLAIDLGGARVAFAVVDREGRILRRARQASRSAGKAVSFEVLARAAEGVVGAAGLPWPEIEGIGLIVPGIYDPATGRAWAPNLWGEAEVRLRERLAPLLPAALTVDSDRSGYVLGE